jgi:hypothetical protein
MHVLQESSLLHIVQTVSGSHQASYPVGTGRGVKLTTRLLLVPRSRKRGSIYPFPHTSSWRSAWLCTGTILPLPYYWENLTNSLLHIFRVTRRGRSIIALTIRYT